MTGHMFMNSGRGVFNEARWILLFSFTLLGCVAEPVSVRMESGEQTAGAEAIADGGGTTVDQLVPSIDMSRVDATLTDAELASPSDAMSTSGDTDVLADVMTELSSDVDAAMLLTDAMFDADAYVPPPEPSSCRVPAPSLSGFCTGARLDEYHCESYGGARLLDATAVGSPTPTYYVQDLQPQSCAFEQYHGLDAFRGTPTMVVLLWAGCGFCQKQTEKLQQMHYELMAEGITVHFVIVNKQADNPLTEFLSERCNFPILQDEESVNAWGLHNGRKDDFYFYDSLGVLKHFIPSYGDIVLSSNDDPPVEPTSGYLNIKNTVRELVEHDGEPPVLPEPEEPMNEQ